MLSLITLITLPLFVNAAPRPVRRATDLSTQDIDGFTPFTNFALAAYCPDNIGTWECGTSCEANSDFEVSANGGDGADIQYYYIGYSPSLQTIIVAHQGTDPKELEADLTDIDIPQDVVDETLFPGLDDDVLVHEGFRDAQAQTAGAVLDSVKSLLASSGSNVITVVGHSLGGALAELDSVFLKLNLPDATVNVVTYGKPRVGNEAWAEAVDATVDSFKRVDNMHDMVPILPGRGLNFAHPEGEIHIVDEGVWAVCPGIDNADDDDCTIKTVPNIFDGSIADHRGPYNGIYLTSKNC
ncbi:alpha/beta-hydrolase [Schizophyllum amplum]|uniref:Alpha/beta-hydrolase n=1 Tax=Schizophyllum amplum TaxID=97359 RepID=A0A550C130_9AGAR|nr:alpha/beta-hydrolase [Auriculariopsis ampla]